MKENIEKNCFTRPKTLNELSLLYLNKEEDFDTLFRDFLHEFNSKPSVNALIEEPCLIDKIKDSYLAATAEQLAYQNDFDIPEWVNKPNYFLDEPFFASSIETLKPILIMESPVTFRRRGIFISVNALKTA